MELDVTQHDKQAMLDQLAQARERTDSLGRDLSAVDGELEALSSKRKQHGLLLDICSALDKLNEQGAADLFWGDAGDHAEQLGRVRSRIDAFNVQLGAIEARRQAVVEQIKRQQLQINLLEDELFEAMEEEERRKQEWIVERDISELPGRRAMMAWTYGGEDDKRFRKSLTATLAICLLIFLLAPLVHVPKNAGEKVKVPDRVVKLLLESKPKPPPKPKTEQKLEEKKKEEKEEPIKEAKEPEKVEKKGILAFKEQLAAVEEDQVVQRLGAQARINDAAGATGAPQRSMLTTSAPGSSGGINLASLSRGMGGGGGSGMGKVAVTRVSSGISGGQEERPLSDGVGPSRTDEEIQIVFDRYKSALYRLYNRELRKDPTLKGQLVLKLTIEPDGSVSACLVQKSDMQAPELSAQIIERVKTINFGAKPGVSAVTILYPIDFLPAA